MPYLECPECGLTVRASAFYLRSDRCPRCQTPMVPTATLRAGRGPSPAGEAGRAPWSSAARGGRFTRG